MRLGAVLSTIFRHPKAREVTGLLVTASALLLLVSLVSFSPHDPS
ncbi:MAG: DNA translocase FtsK 4TM domain-containing protein, partial [Candidatus Methylomirabilales bacterium]